MERYTDLALSGADPPPGTSPAEDRRASEEGAGRGAGGSREGRVEDDPGHDALVPFSREFAIARRFELAFIDEALQGLHEAVLVRESAALIAPAGSGKTVVLRALRDGLPEARFRVRYVKVTGLSRRDMCREIAHAMDVRPAGQLPALVRALQERMQAVESDGLRPVLLLDEAQDMRPETLGLLKIITNFDMDSKLVASVIRCRGADRFTAIQQVLGPLDDLRGEFVGPLRSLGLADQALDTVLLVLPPVAEEGRAV